MRMKLLGIAAGAALALSASAAFATSDSTVIQTNVGTIQVAGTNVQDVRVGTKLNSSAQAIGNSVAITSKTTVTPSNLNDVRVASAQVNSQTLQLGVVRVEDTRVDGATALDVTVGGNTGTFESEDNSIDATTWSKATIAGFLSSQGLTAPAAVALSTPEGFAFQRNVDTAQIGVTLVNDSRFDGKVDSDTASFGNNLSFTAYDNASAVGFQQNERTVQFALGNFTNSSFASANLSTQALGNIGSWTGNASDAIAFQSNAATAQIGITNVSNSTFSGALTAGSVAVGNAVTGVSINH